VVLEFVNPAKKLKLITRGFSPGKWASTARYIVDSAKAGHSGAKMKEIAEKLRYVNWSRVEKPDMGKITNQRFRGLLDEWYRNESSI
jgi:single-stranded DNA-specific DHH superfamily exonuclease